MSDIYLYFSPAKILSKIFFRVEFMGGEGWARMSKSYWVQCEPGVPDGL